jgi:hypothetical protein
VDLNYPLVQSIIGQAGGRMRMPAVTSIGAGAAKQQPVDAEDHLVALSLRYTSVMWDLVADLPDTLYSDSRNRQIMRTLSSLDLTNPPEVDDVVATFDEHMVEHARRILAHLDGFPSPMAGEVREEVLQSIVRLQREQYEALAAHLRAEIHAAEEAKDQASFGELMSYLARLPELHRQLYPRRSPYFRDSRSKKGDIWP